MNKDLSHWQRAYELFGDLQELSNSQALNAADQIKASEPEVYKILFKMLDHSDDSSFTQQLEFSQYTAF